MSSVSYDLTPYESYPFPQSHPERLATIARLLGARPAAVDRCRVLELGCASGGNLLPMAVNLPQSGFVGVDLSARQINDAQRVVDALGLQNVTLHAIDLTMVDETLGEFDYIIAHGLYSWVPEPVQEKLLELCARRLAPHGVAYVSYNTLPGWHFRGMVRDMMLYHAGGLEDPTQRAGQARALLDFVTASVPTDNAYGMMLKSEVEMLRRQQDYYLLHDHLEAVNLPEYFHRFVGRASRYGLQYLGEVEFCTMLPSNFSSEVAQTLSRISGDLVRTEQYMDFLRNRSFRQTLLCHQDVTLQRNVTWASLSGLFVASSMAPPPAEGEVMVFKHPSGATLSCANPVTKMALRMLHEVYPRRIQMEALLEGATARLPGASRPVATMEVLGADLLAAYAVNLLTFHAMPSQFTAEVSERPMATPLARSQAAVAERVTTQLHESVNVDLPCRRILTLADGSRTASEIAAETGVPLDTVVKGLEQLAGNAILVR